MGSFMIDILIPLGNGSRFNNRELRFALRSIERFAPNVRNIYVATVYAPDWLQGVEIVPIPDSYDSNKDANLFDKVLGVCQLTDIADQFLIWSDDQTALKPVDLDKLNIYNPRNRQTFANKGSKANKWEQRMIHTFDYLSSQGVEPDYNWDSHTPHLYNKNDVIRILTGCDYVSLPGYCLDTLLSGMSGKTPDVKQEDVKYTAGTNAAGRRWANSSNSSYSWLGYNDAGFSSGVKEWLECYFPDKSQYEKEDNDMGCGCKKNKLPMLKQTKSTSEQDNSDSLLDDKPSPNDPVVQRRFWDSVRAYAAAVIEWYNAGKPSRTPEEMQERFAICSQCEHFIQIDEEKKRGRCAVCGCYLGVNPHRFLQGNKIAMKTQQCPEDKWD